MLGTRSGDPLVSSGVPLGLVPHGGESASKRARMEPHRPLTIDTREQKVRERSNRATLGGRESKIRPSGREGGGSKRAAGHTVSTEAHVARTVG